MLAITTLLRRIITALSGFKDVTTTYLRLKIRHAIDGLVDTIIKILFTIFGPDRFFDRVPSQHGRYARLAKVELYEAIMHPDDSMELVSILYDVWNGLWKLDAKPTDKQLGRLINREDRVLLLCPRKLVETLARGRQGESMITVEDAYSKWQTKHVLVNRISAPGQKDPLGSLPDFGTIMQGGQAQDLRLTSHDIYHIRNLQGFLLHCSRLSTSAPVAAESILKSWMVTMPQILSILHNKPIMRKCKSAYWELVRRGRVGMTVYLQLHDADYPEDSPQLLVPAESSIPTADTQTIAALRFATQGASSGSMAMPRRHTVNERTRVPEAHTQTPGNQTFAGQTDNQYGKGYSIDDPQTYFQKFGSLVPPERAANILLALSFFLRPPELDWENFPMAEAELKQPHPKSQTQLPEVFIASRKLGSRTAPLPEVTRIAASAVQRQFEANSKIIDVQGALKALGDPSPQDQLRRTRPAASNDEMDRLRDPFYHQMHYPSLSVPVHLSQGPAGYPGEKGFTTPNSMDSTPQAANGFRMASTDSTETVKVHKQPNGNGTALAGKVNGNGAALNPTAAPFTGSTMPSNGSLTSNGEKENCNCTGAAPSIRRGKARWRGIKNHQNGTAHPDSGYNSANPVLLLDGESVAPRVCSKSPTAGSGRDSEQGGARLAEQ